MNEGTRAWALFRLGTSLWDISLCYSDITKLGWKKKQHTKFETFTMSSMSEQEDQLWLLPSLDVLQWPRGVMAQSTKHITSQFPQSQKFLCGISCQFACEIDACHVMWLFGYAWGICLQGSCSWLAADGDHNFPSVRVLGTWQLISLERSLQGRPLASHSNPLPKVHTSSLLSWSRAQPEPSKVCVPQGVASTSNVLEADYPMNQL